MSPGGDILPYAGKGPAYYDDDFEPRGGYSGDGGPALEAFLDEPQDIAVDSAGNLFIADYGNGRIRKVDPRGIITTIAGGTATLGDGGPAIQAMLNRPQGIALDLSGNLYIADTHNHRIRKAFGIAAPGLFAGRPLSPLPPQLGDANLDGQVSLPDAVLVLQAVTGQAALTPEQLSVADMDGKDGVNVADAILILRRIVGLS
ncbi:MAG: hypothetical protein KY468_12165 [Armatimonadetes bacterium]|nr:hypothetical protein [Armatimonadota bacterium]